MDINGNIEIIILTGLHENAFGIMASRFSVLRQPIRQNYKNAIAIIKACVVLHNLFLKFFNDDKKYLNPQMLRREDEDGRLTPGSWEQETSMNNLSTIGHVAGNRSGTAEARFQRDILAEKFVSDNLAPWQFKSAHIAGYHCSNSKLLKLFHPSPKHFCQTF